MAAVLGVKLPRIAHPAHRHCSTDINLLKLQGNKLADNKYCTGIKTSAKKKRVRPFSVPTNLKTRPQSSQLSIEKLIDALSDKLRGNGYFMFRNAFTSFDPENRGCVTREALYRILCNIMNGITRSQYNEILKRLNLVTKQTITFHEFYSCFRVLSGREKSFLDRVTHHGPRQLTAEYVHSMLVARAKQCIHRLSDFLPRWKGLEGRLGQLEFRNILSSMSLPLHEEEYQKLWNKYDPHGKGVLTGEELMTKLGIVVSRPSTMSSTFSEGACTTLSDEEQDIDIDILLKEIADKLQYKTESLLKTLKQNDATGSGKVRSSQLLSSLHQLGVPITQDQCNHMLIHLGYQPERIIDYQSFLTQLMSTSATGITNTILTDKQQNFHVPEKGRACISTADAESRLVCTLQHDFLTVLAKIRSHDPRGRGYITRDTFVKVLETLIPSSSSEVIHKLTNRLQDQDNGLIPYPKFLAMFDGPPRLRQPSGSNEDETEENNKETVDELKLKLSEMCKTAPHKIMDAFEVLDPNNTERITKDIFQQMLFRLGLNADHAVTGEIWRSVLKNKDGSIDPHQLVRHFAQQKSQKGKAKISDDYMHMRSRYLHRDDEMVLKNLKTTLTVYQGPLLAYLRHYDPSSCGLIPQEIFNEVFLSLSPHLTPQELSYLTQTYLDPMSHMINYHTLMKNLPSPPPIYKTGNDLRSILAHPNHTSLRLPLVHQQVTLPPQHGIPGVKARLQKQLQQRWGELRRQLMRIDPAGTGHITVKEFRYILQQYGVSLNRDDMYYILQEFDPMGSGAVDYGMFLQVLMGEIN